MLVDTPGIFEPRRRLDRAMVQAAWGGTQDADIIALVIDAKAGLGAKVEIIVEALKDRKEPKLLILNKVDISAKETLLVHARKLNDVLDFKATFFVSAATGDGLPELKRTLGIAMPERSEEHTSELQSLMRISYAVFCLKKKNKKHNQNVFIYT